MKKIITSSLVVTLFAATLFTTSANAAQREINVYSARQAPLIEPLAEAFTKETGIKVNFVFGGADLLEKLKQEKDLTPADVYLTVGIHAIYAFQQSGLALPIKSAVLEKNIPAQFRDSDNQWYGLSLRTRVIYTSKDRVGKLPANFEYIELADPKYRGKVCTRSGKHNYNVSLFASMIAHYGPEKTEQFLRGLKANLATKPAGGDRDQVKNITEGLCDYSIGNSYYYGKMIDDPKQKAWAEASDINFPSMGGKGTVANISAAAVTKYSKNKADAIKFLEFLSGLKAQKIYADVNHEYPVNPKAEQGRLTSTFGKFTVDPLPLTTIAKYYNQALELVDKVDYDNAK